ncbi:MAG: DUF86 domain-containing protein [Methanoregulaceae archaeon]
MDKIQRYISGKTYQEFVGNELLIDAVERNLEKIGEAAAALPDSLRDQYPEIPWKNIVGLRNKVIHHYFGVDKGVIWQIVTRNLPETRRKIETILQELAS